MKRAKALSRHTGNQDNPYEEKLVESKQGFAWKASCIKETGFDSFIELRFYKVEAGI